MLCIFSTGVRTNLTPSLVWLCQCPVQRRFAVVLAGILIVVAIGVALGVLIGGILLSVVAYYMRR